MPVQGLLVVDKPANMLTGVLLLLLRARSNPYIAGSSASVPGKGEAKQDCLISRVRQQYPEVRVCWTCEQLSQHAADDAPALICRFA